MSRSVEASVLARFLPFLDWTRGYDRETLIHDGIAAAVVTLMLIPQSLAYAMLAGLPPQIGLYASVLPIMAYALFGSSRTLAVGPVAILSLLTLAAAGRVGAPGSAEFIAAALILAFLSGLILLVMGVLRLGFLANLLSHPVVSGFITASAVLIVISQLKHLFGISAPGHTAPEMIASLISHLGDTHLLTLILGVSVMAFLFWARFGAAAFLARLGLNARAAGLTARLLPIAAIVGATLAVAMLRLDAQGVHVTGAIPAGFPPLTLPVFDAPLWLSLIGPAALLAMIGFVESVSVAQTLAAKRRETIDPNQELAGLGMANVAASLTGGYPVTGGLARSIVNFEAGARTPAAGIFTALGILLSSLLLTPWLAKLPSAALSATIIVAVSGLMDWKILRRVWSYSKSDFTAILATILVTLGWGVEPGILTGVGLSLALFVWRASRPHAAIVGRVPGSEHFRNIKRHAVFTDPRLLTLRVDESLTFLNARWLEGFVQAEVAHHPELKHLILMCSAVNMIDASALESLERIHDRLRDADIALHFSEVKGPVMDRIGKTHLVRSLSGEVWLSQHAAFDTLIARLDRDAANALERDPLLPSGLI